jgi:hypothetical protein
LDSFDSDEKFTLKDILQGFITRVALSTSDSELLFLVPSVSLGTLHFKLCLIDMPGFSLMENRVIDYSYDTNGNLASLAPPGRFVHTFSHTAVNSPLAPKLQFWSAIV